MALDIPMPWLRTTNPIESLSSGASAGASAARLEQEGLSESSRLALEAQRMTQSAALQQAQLQQAAEQHQMEFQARQKLAEQNQLREQQQLNIENAYKTAQLGVAQGRLQEAQKVAEDKARAAALTFQREQAFAKDVASGIPVMEAYQRNPVSSALLSSVGRSQLKEDQTGKPIVREGKFPLIEYDPATGITRQLYTPSPQPSPAEILKDLRHQRDQLEKASPRSDEEKQLNDDKIRALQYKIDRITHGKSLTESVASKTDNSIDDKELKKSDPKSKIVRAHALGIAHPDWTKQQIIDAVNKEMP